MPGTAPPTSLPRTHTLALCILWKKGVPGSGTASGGAPCGVMAGGVEQGRKEAGVHARVAGGCWRRMEGVRPPDVRLRHPARGLQAPLGRGGSRLHRAKPCLSFPF